MGPRAATAIVLAVSAATGVVLARGAIGAVGVPPSAGIAMGPKPVVVAAAPAGSAAAVAPGASSHDDDESEEPRGPPENPYDDATPRPAIVRQQVLARDGMLRLAGGRFTIGSSNQRAPANERPARPVTVGPFWIDRTEVTVAAYRACVDAGACSRPARTSATCTFDANEGELPVSCVHWRDADAFCRYAGKRLPSEREWEYAARGTFATPFPWGPTASCANALTLVNDQSGRSCGARPARVGARPGGASVFGVLDMSGNVEEWTADWYVESLGAGPAPRAGAAHVLRGGGWLSAPSQSRTTSRNWGSAVEAGPNVGFRCAKDAEP